MTDERATTHQHDTAHGHHGHDHAHAHADACGCGHDHHHHHHHGAMAMPHRVVKIGRNDPCPCGSGKKYKKCCIDKH